MEEQKIELKMINMADIYGWIFMLIANSKLLSKVATV